MKIHSALIVVKKETNPSHDQKQAWFAFADGIQYILRTTTTVEMLAETVFLISLKDGMFPASRILAYADQNELTYRVLFLEEGGPEWVFSQKQQS